MKPPPRRRIVDHLKVSYQISERRACGLLKLARMTYHYRSRRDPRTQARQRMREIAAARVRYGYRKIRVLLQREGFELSKKVVYRLYREEGLSLRYRASRKRRAHATRPARAPVKMPNHVWGLDFVCDQLSQGQRFRALTVVDVFTREALAIEVGQQLRAGDVVACSGSITAITRLPRRLVLRQWVGIHQPARRPVGLPPQGAHRLQPTWKAYGQCVRGILQREVPR